jgi:hypothetical protein
MHVYQSFFILKEFLKSLDGHIRMLIQELVISADSKRRRAEMVRWELSDIMLGLHLEGREVIETKE